MFYIILFLKKLKIKKYNDFILSYIFTFLVLIIIIWWILVSTCCHFLSAMKITFTISYKTNLLAISSPSLYLSENIFISSPILTVFLLIEFLADS